MEIRQLQAVIEIVRAGNHVSDAAKALHTSQSGVSRSIQQLEKELGFKIFQRTRNRVIGLTDAGQEVLEIAQRIVGDAESLGSLKSNLNSPDAGRLVIATTHTFAIYVLPTVIGRFVRDYPDVKVSLLQGDPESICELVNEREADIAIGTDARRVPDGLINFACRELDRCIVAPLGHQILSADTLTLEDVASHPIISYGANFSGRWKVLESFERAGLTPDVVLRVIDADVCKTYVRLGLGLGVLTNIAVDPRRDKGLGARDASHLFASSTAFLRVRRNTFFPPYALEFVQRFSPSLTPTVIRKVQRDGTLSEVDVRPSRTVRTDRGQRPRKSG